MQLELSVHIDPTKFFDLSPKESDAEILGQILPQVQQEVPIFQFKALMALKDWKEEGKSFLDSLSPDAESYDEMQYLYIEHCFEENIRIEGDEAEILVQALEALPENCSFFREARVLAARCISQKWNWEGLDCRMDRVKDLLSGVEQESPLWGIGQYYVADVQNSLFDEKNRSGIKEEDRAPLTNDQKLALLNILKPITADPLYDHQSRWHPFHSRIRKRNYFTDSAGWQLALADDLELWDEVDQTLVSLFERMLETDYEGQILKFISELDNKVFDRLNHALEGVPGHSMPIRRYVTSEDYDNERPVPPRMARVKRAFTNFCEKNTIEPPQYLRFMSDT